MDFEKIRERYRTFLAWDSTNIQERIAAIANEYAYFQTMYFHTSKAHTEIEKEIDTLWQGKYKFYRHEFDDKLNPSEIKGFIDKDLDILSLRGKMSNHKTYLTFFEECMKNLNNMRWDIKSYIDYMKFKSGLH